MGRLLSAVGATCVAVVLLSGAAWGSEPGEPSCPMSLTDIVSWWPGEDDALDIVDSNHGVLINGTSFVPGLVNQASRVRPMGRA